MNTPKTTGVATRYRSNAALVRGVVKAATSQGLSSIGNICISFALARSLSAEEFGSWSRPLLLAGFVVSTFRSSIGVMLLSGAESLKRCSLTRLVAGIGLFGSLASVSLAAIVALASHDAKWLIVGIVIPFTLMQEAVRHAAFGRRRPGTAASADLIWTIVALAILASTTVISANGPTLVLCWGAGAAAGSVLVFRLRDVERPIERWLHELGAWRRRLSALLIENWLGAGAGLLSLLVAGAVLSSVEFSGLRAGVLLLGISNVSSSALGFIFFPRMVASKNILRDIRAMTRALLGCHICFSALMLIMPDALGRMMLGDTWSQAGPLLPWVLGSAVPACLSGPLYTAIRARGRLGPLLRVQAPLAALFLVVPGVGAQIHGAVGYLVADGLVALAAIPLVRRVARVSGIDVAPETSLLRQRRPSVPTAEPKARMVGRGG